MLPITHLGSNPADCPILKAYYADRQLTGVSHKVSQVRSYFEALRVFPQPAVSQAEKHLRCAAQRLLPTRGMYRLFTAPLAHLQLDEHFFLYGTTSDIHFLLARQFFVERRVLSLPKNK